MRINPCVEAVTGELERAGLNYSIHQNRHVHIRWTHGNAERFIVVSTSPSSSNAPWRSRSDVRRVLRRDGYRI
jgi:hypothetical protein